MKTVFRAFGLLPLLIPAAICADEVRVAVASNFTPVLEQLEPLFESQSGHDLMLISGATGSHYAQIVNGAPFDVFLAADAERPGLLEEAGKSVPGTTFTYAIGKLVLWSMDAATVDAAGAVLKAGDFEHIAIANPQLAPYGEAARAVLMELGLWDTLQPRVVSGDNIAQTLQFVQTGNAELGFIAESQWIDIGNIGSHWRVPPELHEPIVQQGVMLKDTPAAQAFVGFLLSEESRAAIRAAGYELPGADETAKQ